MSPATATTTPSAHASTPAVKPAETVVMVVAAMVAPVERAPVDGATTASTSGQPSPVATPRLKDGKSIPGPDEWRALERRALSFRLRGGNGAIGR